MTMTTAKTKRRGRPSALTDALKEEICLRIIDGETIRQIAASAHMPDASTIYRALAGDDTEFRDQYARAKEVQLYAMEEDLLEIADGAAQADMAGVHAARLRIDARKWIMAKRAPKKYGERVEQVMGPNDDAKEMAEKGSPWAIVNINGVPYGSEPSGT